MGETRAVSARLGMSLLACVALAACHGSGISSVGVNATKSTLSPGESATLTATILGTGDFSTAVIWSIDGGGPGLTFSGATATYTAPLVGATTTVVVRATSTEDASKSGTTSIAINVALGVQVVANPTELSAGQVSTLTATPAGSVPGIVWSIDSAGPGSLSATTGTTVTYTAPASVAAQTPVTIRAASSADPLVFGTAAIALKPITVVITPGGSARLASQQTLTLNGTVTPSTVDPGVSWMILSGGGSISATSGSDIFFTAPKVDSEQMTVIRAIPTADPAQHTDFTVTVDHGWPAVVTSGTSPGEVARGIAVDYTTFAVYVAGETNGHFDVPASLGMTDGFVAKFDQYGNTAWVRQFGTENTDNVTAVTADLDGNVYVSGHTIGRTWTPGLPNPQPSGGSIGFVLAYDKDGGFKWRADFGPVALVNDCGVYALAMDQNQKIFAAGSCIGVLIGFVQQCDASGCGGQLTVVDSSTTPPFTTPFLRGIAVDAFGNYDLVGSTSAGSPSSGFVAQVRPNNCSGNTACPPAWFLQVDAVNPGADDLRFAAVATDGSNVFVGGTVADHVAGQTSAGGSDAVLMSFDHNGNPGWTQQFGTPADDRTTGVTYDALFLHQVYATGTIDRSLVTMGDEDVFLSFYSAAGTLANPQVSFEDSSSTDEGGGVALADAHGNLILGFTTGAQLGGPPTVGLHVGVRKTDAFGNPLSL